MKVLKIILMVLAVIVLAFCVIAASGPTEMHVKETVMISASPAEVFSEISDLRTWEEWGAWQTRDTAMVHEYSGAESGLGAINSWKSESEGNGSQEIIEAEAGKSMKMEMKFEGFDKSSFAAWNLEAKEGGTLVSWTMDQENIDFVSRFFMVAFQIEKNVSKDYRESLDQLKIYVESQERFEADVLDMEDAWYVGWVRNGLSDADLASGKLHEEAYGKILEAIAKGESEMISMPMYIVHRYDNGIMDAEFAIMVPDSIPLDTNLNMGFIPGGKALSALHVGPYESTGSTWQNMDNYLESNGYELRASPYEMYVNDPADVSGPEEYQTQIVYPVR